MQLFCPKCHGAFAGAQRCPRCGGLLLLPHEAAAALPPQPVAAAPPAPAPAGRVLVGAVFALGIYLGLRKLLTGAVLAAAPDPDGWWGSAEGLAATGSAQLLAVAFGAVLAAAGRVGGFVFGATVGAVCGALFLGAELIAGAPTRDLVMYLQPLVLLAAGGVFGVFASRVWGAVPAVDLPAPPDPGKLSSLRFTAPSAGPVGRPTAWARVLLGAALIVASVALADEMRKGAQRYSEGLLRVSSVGQARFISWQLAMLGAVAGAALAGASTGSGPRHGLLAGALGGVGVLGATAARGETLSPVAYWLDKLSLGGLPPTAPAAVVAAVGGLVLVGLVGGWLGGTLFQPLAPDRLRGRLRTGLD